MSDALPGEHYCATHQGNHSHYDPRNCTVCQLQAKVADLEGWKKSTLEVEAEFNAQELGHMLGGQWGESSRAVIMREVPRLLQRCKDLREENIQLRRDLKVVTMKLDAILDVLSEAKSLAP